MGVKFVVLVSNGTAALHSAAYAAGVAKGDDVLVSDMSFVASANCALYQGANPILVDIDEKTGNIDVKDMERRLTKNTKAVVVVDYAGQPVDHDEIDSFCQKNNLILIEDAAHAIGATYRSKKVGTLSTLTTFSFHPVKNITTGEGGAVATNKPALYEKLLLFRNHGITRDKDKLSRSEGDWYYEMIDLGYNYRITDFQAALGISQLNKLDKFLEKRRLLASLYIKLFKKLDFVKPIEIKNDRLSAWHIFPALFDFSKFRVDKRTFFRALRAENIGVNVHYIPIHRLHYYKSKGYQEGDIPTAERFYNAEITLPLFPSLKEKDVEKIVEVVSQLGEYYHV